LKPQLWCAREKGRKPNLDIKIRNDPHFTKPIGGLWTSTYTPDEEYCSDWIRWCAYEMPEWLTGECYVLYPRKDARIYTIDSYSDLERLFRKYGIRVVDTFAVLDWERIAKDYDAVHLTHKGMMETHLSRPLSLYGWDCESTVWFRNVFEKVEPLPKDRRCKVLPDEKIPPLSESSPKCEEGVCFDIVKVVEGYRKRKYIAIGLGIALVSFLAISFFLGEKER